MFSLGLDIGGTKIEALVLDARGREVYRKRFNTEKQSYETFFQSVIDIIENTQHSVSQAMSIGMCLPGTVEPSNGLIKNSNILVLNQKPFASMLEQACGQPVAISNDANCFTLSEAIDGAGKGYPVVFGATLGTGVGGGVTIDQIVIDGRNRCAGEWGHNGLPRFEPARDGDVVPCYCGQTNCIETFLSGTGLAERFRKRFGRNLNSLQIIEAWHEDDEQAIYAIDLFQDQLARALADVVNIIDPNIIVIGGGLSNSRDLYKGLEKRIARYVFSNTFTTPVALAVHGDSSGVRGAAWLGRQAVQRKTSSNEELKHFNVST